MAPIPLTGRAIQGTVRIGLGRGAFQRLLTGMFGMEVMYSFVIILASLMIYYSTRELWELSKHKGIKYFRYTFLFFALAYFFRSFIKFALIYFDVDDIVQLPLQLIGPLSLFIFIYFSTMALFYLLYSLVHKRWNHNWSVGLLHFVSLAVAFISVVTRNIALILVLNIAILLFVISAGYVAHRETRKRKNSLYAVYMLLFVFWILNILDILIPSGLQTYQLLIYLASTGVFLSILYKVLRKAGS